MKNQLLKVFLAIGLMVGTMGFSASALACCGDYYSYGCCYQTCDSCCFYPVFSSCCGGFYW